MTEALHLLQSTLKFQRTEQERLTKLLTEIQTKIADYEAVIKLIQDYETKTD